MVKLKEVSGALQRLMTQTSRNIDRKQELLTWLQKQNQNKETRRTLAQSLANQEGSVPSLIRANYKTYLAGQKTWRARLEELLAKKFEDPRERSFELQHFIKDPNAPGVQHVDLSLLVKEALKYFPNPSRPGGVSTMGLPDFLALPENEVRVVLTERGKRDISGKWEPNALLRLHSSLNKVLKAGTA